MFVNTTVYVVGVTQYKATLRLPRWTGYTRNEVAKVAEEQDVRTVPSLPQGTFDVLHSSEDHQVAVFRYSFATGCRQTDSSQHGKLPKP